MFTHDVSGLVGQYAHGNEPSHHVAYLFRWSDRPVTLNGRALDVTKDARFATLFEFKIRGTSEEAMAQIEEKGYAAKFASDPRKLFRIGCAFDWDARNLGRWLIG